MRKTYPLTTQLAAFPRFLHSEAQVLLAAHDTAHISAYLIVIISNDPITAYGNDVPSVCCDNAVLALITTGLDTARCAIPVALRQGVLSCNTLAQGQEAE